MTVSYLPPGRPGDARWNAPGRVTVSPAQDKLRHSARRWVWHAAAFAILFGIFATSDLLEIHAIHDTPHPMVHRAQGVVDVLKVSQRRPVFRLSQGGAEPLLFKCSASVVAEPRCPIASTDWRPRELSVEWITMPSLLWQQTDARATRVVGAGDVLFAATPRAVQEAEVADLQAARRGGFAVLGGLMLASAAIALVQFARLRALTREIEAAHARARA